MTEQTSEQPVQPPLTVTVDVSQLGEADALTRYYAAYPAALAAYEEAKERLDALKDGIKFELTQRAPQGTAGFTINGIPGAAPVRLDWRVSKRFDSRLFLKRHPEMAAAYEECKKPSGSWTLTVVKGGE